MTQSASSRRRTRAQAGVILPIALASILAHGAAVVVIHVGSPMSADLMAAAARAASRPTEWTVSCEAEAALGASARLGVCASPFAHGGPSTCARDALKTLEFEIIQCHQSPEDVTVQLVDISDLDLTLQPLLPDVAPVEDVVAAELIEKEVAEKVEQAQKEISRPTPTGQVVEITRPQNEVVPDKARYLSEYDSSAEKQTVARGSTEKMVDRPAPRDLPPTAETNPDKQETPPTPATSAVQGPGQGPADAPTKLTMRGPGEAAEAPPADRSKPGEKSGQELATIDGIEARRGEGGRLTRTTETTPPGGTAERAGGGGNPTKTPDLRPTEEVIERAVGGGSVDHLEDAEEGDFTSLNSRKWKYATFFNRMKRQVAQNWHPDTVYLRRDPTGNIYGTRDRLTVLQVSLNPNGSVAKIYVAQQSGVDFLDDEAVRAFRQAQPFPNPPTGLVDARSNLITFSFGFHFGIGGDRSRWKVFRHQ